MSFPGKLAVSIVEAKNAWAGLAVEERRHLITSQLLLQKHLAMLADPVNLENILCQVNTYSRKLHGERPSRFKWLINASTLAH